jgi:hypothetical protein
MGKSRRGQTVGMGTQAGLVSHGRRSRVDQLVHRI